MLACPVVRSSPWGDERGLSTGEEARDGTTMTKAELIDEVSKLSNLTKKETETIVNT